jgi:oligopeptide transport system substrate-binding protein
MRILLNSTLRCQWDRANRKAVGFTALALFLLGVLSACHPSSSADHSVLRRGLAGEPSTLDPGLADDIFSNAVLMDLYEGLTALSPSGEVIPGVAESWTVDPTGTEYTFHLRAEARWSNGQKVRAQDFVYSWRRVIDPKFGSPSADDFRLIAHGSAIIAGKEPSSALAVSAPSDTVLMIKLDRPAPYFPQILARSSTYPVYLKNTAVVGTHDPRKWISNGPYVLSDWLPTTGAELRINQAYWDRNHVRIKSVRYDFIQNDSAQYAAYRAGQLDMTDIVPVNALPKLRQETPTELKITPFLGTVYYGINLANQALSSVGLRQALALAIDRKRLVESLGFGQIPAYSFVPPGTANYTPQQWDWGSLSDVERVQRAKQLYERAGFSIAKPLRLRVLFNANEVIQRTAVLIAAMWKEVLGIEVELTGEEYKVFLQSRHDTARWDVARLAWNADFNDASNFLEVLRGHSPDNDMSYQSSQFDSDLDNAADSPDPTKRRTELQAAEQVMLNDYPIIPLYYLVSKRLVKPFLHGVVTNPFGHVPSKGLTLEAR